MATNRKRPLSNDEVEPDSHTIAKTLLKGECRRTYRKQMRPKDFKEHGCSTNCLGCEWIQNGLYGLIGYRNHTDLCRQRTEEASRRGYLWDVTNSQEWKKVKLAKEDQRKCKHLSGKMQAQEPCAQQRSRPWIVQTKNGRSIWNPGEDNYEMR